MSAAGKQLRPLVFFLDRSLECSAISEAFSNAGVAVELHRSYFEGNAPDEEWLAEAGRQNWVVLTRDTRIRYHPNEKQALINSRVRVFVLTAKGLKGQEMADLLVKRLAKIQKIAEELPAPFIASVTRSGVEVLYRE